VELLDQLPGLAKRRRVHTPGVGQALLYGAVTALILAILYFGYPRLVEVVTRFVPVTWEEQVGQASAEQIAQVFSRGKDGPQFCGAGPGAAALRRLTGRLVAKTQSPYQWRVRVVPTGKVNAFAAPGGHILILSGLIKQAKSPDEVAGVLAHEIGHVVLRHSTQSLIQQMGITSLFTILFGNQGILPGLGELLIAFSFSREAETEADGFALELLANAGIRAGGLKRFFARLAKKSEKLPDFLTMLSTHPASGQRAQQAKKGPEGDPGMSDRDWADLRKICPG
jgi:Zn-dependent protease with chaperone function